jgi:iron-regulated transporter 1
MTGYLKALGVEELYIGVGKACMALVGILSTFVYSWHVKRFGIDRTGLHAAVALAVLLIPSLISVFIKDWTVSAILLVVGVVISRIGLWVFDMSITQIQQETVPEDERGTVGLVQNSTQQLMFLIHFVRRHVYIHTLHTYSTYLSTVLVQVQVVLVSRMY